MLSLVNFGFVLWHVNPKIRFFHAVKFGNKLCAVYETQFLEPINLQSIPSSGQP